MHENLGARVTRDHLTVNDSVCKCIIGALMQLNAILHATSVIEKSHHER